MWVLTLLLTYKLKTFFYLFISYLFILLWIVYVIWLLHGDRFSFELTDPYLFHYHFIAHFNVDFYHIMSGSFGVPFCGQYLISIAKHFQHIISYKNMQFAVSVSVSVFTWVRLMRSIIVCPSFCTYTFFVMSHGRLIVDKWDGGTQF